MVAYSFVREKLRERWYVRGSVEEAWNRCGEYWALFPRVEQCAPHTGAGLCHWLTVAFGRRFRTEKAFLIGKLGDPDPLLAAYAFKCLVHTGQLQREDLPLSAWARTEEINIGWANRIWRQTLASYFEGYFGALSARQ
jgi:hypothetical protein